MDLSWSPHCLHQWGLTPPSLAGKDCAELLQLGIGLSWPSNLEHFRLTRSQLGVVSPARLIKRRQRNSCQKLEMEGYLGKHLELSERALSKFRQISNFAKSTRVCLAFSMASAGPTLEDTIPGIPGGPDTSSCGQHSLYDHLPQGSLCATE